MDAILLTALSGHERIEAVHKTFANKSSADALELVLWVGAFAAVLITLLVVLNRLERYFRRRGAQRKKSLRPAPSQEPAGTRSGLRSGARRPPTRSPTAARLR